VIPGNHDNGGPGSIWNQEFFEREREKLAPNLVVCRESVAMVTDNFVLYPCPLARRAESSDTTAWLRDGSAFAEAQETLPRIVLAHGSVMDFGSRQDDLEDDAGATNRIDLDRLPWDDIDYLALGDWHGTKAVHEKAWYSGTPEYDRFPKGGDYTAGQVLIVEVERGVAPQVKTVETWQLTWHEHHWTFHDDTDLDTLSKWVDETFATRTQKDLLKLVVDGALGLEASRRLDELIDRLEARLLRLKLVNKTHIAPTEAELEALTGDTANPLTARVASALHRQVVEFPDQADTARLALRQLYLMRARLCS
jgi:DNA repair exonuclease SbcCD nuclease subunit